MNAPRPSPPRLRALVLLLLALLALALAWQFTPARAWLQPDALLAAVGAWGWAWQMAAFVLAGCLAVPLSLLVLLTVLVQGPVNGALSCLLGGALVGSLSFALGALLGRRAVAAWAGPRMQALNALVARRGVLAVVLVRLVPAAPFAVVNLLLGSTSVRWLPFLVGNTVGMLPLVGATAWLAPQIVEQLRSPDHTGWGLLGLTAAVLGAGAWALRRWATRQVGS